MSKLRKTAAKFWLALLLTLGALSLAVAQPKDAGNSLFTRTDFMVPMRDGTQLLTVVMRPTASTGPLPLILIRTPYGAASLPAALGDKPTSYLHEFVSEGYLFVFQDIRGRYQSQGEFVMTRPPGSSRTDESTDTWDTIDWLIKNQWARNSGESLGNISFGSKTGEYYRHEIEAPWFAYWLKDKGHPDFPEARVFDAGARLWRSFDAWPPKDAVATKLYFAANGSLSFDRPKDTRGDDAFVSDPAHPVPYRPRPVEWTYADGSRWARWMTEDQRFVDGRPDVLTWQTPPLDRDVTIAGAVRAQLFGSTTGSDVDWVVKLIDVYPDSAEGPVQMRGYELMIAGDVMRGRYWKGFEQATPVPKNTIVEFPVDLHQLAYTLLKGHRIMVQVQSTWFPLYDRNPQTFTANIFKAEAGDYRAQTHHVSRSASHPSNVEVNVLR